MNLWDFCCFYVYLLLFPIVLLQFFFIKNNRFKAWAKTGCERINIRIFVKRPYPYWSAHVKHFPKPDCVYVCVWEGLGGPWMFLVKITSQEWRSLMQWVTACPLHFWLRDSVFEADLLKPVQRAEWSHLCLLRWEGPSSIHIHGLTEGEASFTIKDVILLKAIVTCIL